MYTVGLKDCGYPADARVRVLSELQGGGSWVGGWELGHEERNETKSFERNYVALLDSPPYLIRFSLPPLSILSLHSAVSFLVLTCVLLNLFVH